MTETLLHQLGLVGRAGAKTELFGEDVPLIWRTIDKY